jgi:hypothetical protein
MFARDNCKPNMQPKLTSEITRGGRHRWLKINELPISRAIAYKLISEGKIEAVVLNWPGSKRGRRLVDGDSLDAYLESLVAEQKGGGNVQTKKVKQEVA